jgi:multidrug efflux pump subunit AcrA (membrane-fusion protein)
MSTMESAVTAEDSTGTDLDSTAGPGMGASTEPEPRSHAAANPAFAGPDALRRNRTVTTLQLSGSLAIVAVCVLAVLWYVPGIIRSDSHSFTGTVVSNGITNLNFASSGLVGRIQVHLGQTVKAGQVLASETSSSTSKSLSADRASIAAAQASLSALRAEPVTPTTSASIAAANAQLAKGQAQLSADKVTLSEAQVVAPTGGTVIAINAQPGETVTSAGVRSYSALPQPANSQSPPFSLLPEGPTTTLKTGSTQTALPMIALRTSTSWEVTTLVPESHISSVRPGQTATILVPAVGLRQIHGVVRQVAPTPVSTSAGTAYQVTISITGHRQTTPLNGMTADVQLSS